MQNLPILSVLGWRSTDVGVSHNATYAGSYMKTASSVAACCVIGYSMSFWALIHDKNVPFPL